MSFGDTASTVLTTATEEGRSDRPAGVTAQRDGFSPSFYSTAEVSVLRLPEGVRERDVVAVEEPLEIWIDGQSVAVTMRTPGHDEELALGVCLTQGMHPLAVRLPDDYAANTVEVEADGFDAERLRRNFYTSSSCGVCGLGAIDAVAVDAPPVESSFQMAAAVVAQLPALLRTMQVAFAATGGLHAAGLFTGAGESLCVREDVGRHNALDKVIGWAFGAGLLPLSSFVLCLSGRVSFELVQKAAVAGCPVIAAVGVPSSLALQLARDRRVTVCGFIREKCIAVYTESQRIRGSCCDPTIEERNC
ncbi:MAG: formate dehydrogenase accessory sulfurtransferase FdhD [Acidimicrobiales bacterium]